MSHLVALVVLAAACGGDAEPVIDVGDGGDYSPEIDPSSFVAEIDNPFFPLPPGATSVYEGTDGDESERIEIEVLTETRTVMGIEATVVHDAVYVDGELIEDTFDWYAQDAEGNVWYLGEDSREIEDGEVVSTEGSWEAGVDGALPGIVMQARPVVGSAYRQEYYPDEAEDVAEIVRTDETVTIGGIIYEGVLVIAEWNRFEPDVVEEKYYAPGIGVILEQKVEGGDGRVELVESSLG